MGLMITTTRRSIPSFMKKKNRMRKISYKDLDFTDLVFSNNENVALIWFDENIDKCTDVLDTKALLRITNCFVLFCADKETCLNQINIMKNKKLILILAGKCAQSILEQVHLHEHIDSIFIFCIRSDRYCLLREQFTKIINIHTRHDTLFCDLNRTISNLRSHLDAFSLLNPKTRLRHLETTSAGFFWFLLLKKALMRLPANELSKQDMINHCRNYYRRKLKQLKDINEFEQKYQSDDAVYWYSRSSFISHLVNKALRTENIDLLYIFRFFIVDLSQSIRSLAAKQSSNTNTILYLKRGLTLSEKEITELHANIGNYISPNGFMSASRCADVANIYGTNALFEIEVNMNLNICADIKEQSAFYEEKEFVFDLGSVFRVDNVYYNKERWVIKITATSDGDQLIENVLESNNTTNHPEIFFGELIYLMGNYKQAKQYFNHLSQEYLKEKYISINQDQFLKTKSKCNRYIRKISDKELIDSKLVLVMIAEIYQMMGNNEKAMEHLQSVLNTSNISSKKN